MVSRTERFLKEKKKKKNARRQFTVLIESLIETRTLSFALFTEELAPLYGTRDSPLRFPRWRRFLVIARFLRDFSKLL